MRIPQGRGTVYGASSPSGPLHGSLHAKAHQLRRHEPGHTLQAVNDGGHHDAPPRAASAARARLHQSACWWYTVS